MLAVGILTGLILTVKSVDVLDKFSIEQMERNMSRMLWHLSALAQMHGLDAEKLLSDQCVSYISRVDEAEKQTKNSTVLDENGKKALLDENFS